MKKKKTREYTWNEELGKILDGTLPKSVEAEQHDRNESIRRRAKRESSGDVPPLPPMNPDGTWKSIAQLVSADKVQEWEAYKADAKKVAQMDYESAHDPEQLRWESEMGIGAKKKRKIEYELAIPDSVKIIIFVILLVSSIIGMIKTW